MAVVALLVAVPVVLLIPRARTSPAFDRLLWAATVVVGFLVAWIAVAMAKNASILDVFVIADTPVLPVIIGALGGAFALNLPLWFQDRFQGSASGEITVQEGPEQMVTPDERPEDRT